MQQFPTVTTFAVSPLRGSRSIETQRAYKNEATENSLCNTTSTIHNGYYPKQITWKFKIALYILTQEAVILNICDIVRKLLAEDQVRSAWSARPLLFWETAKLLWSGEGGWWQQQHSVGKCVMKWGRWDSDGKWTVLIFPSKWLPCGKILILILRYWEYCMSSIQYNMDFVQEHLIYTRTKVNHRGP